MKNRSLAWLLAPQIAAAMLFLGACTSPQDAGKEVLPDDDLLDAELTDTFSISFETRRMDSVPTANLSRCLIGNYVDEHFGPISCGTFIQPRLTGSNLSFGTNPADLRLDSIVLTLDLLDFYGRYNDPITLEVYRITEGFNEDSAYSSISSLNYDAGYDFGNGQQLDFSGLPGFFDFVNLRLDDSLGRLLLFAPTDSLANQSVFTTFFKGLHIRSTPVDFSQNREPGGVFSIDPRSTKTSLTLHYHDGAAKKSYTFPINENSQRFHKIQRGSYAGTILEDAVTNQGFNATYACIQAGALTKALIKIPHFDSIGPAGIHRAELWLPIDPTSAGSGDRFEPPSTLYFFAADETGEKERDLEVVNASVDYDETKKGYLVPMTQTLQQILAGRFENHGFIVVPGNNGVSLNRVILAGPGHPTVQPELRIMYTPIK